jgi:hypothetical protein
VNHWLVSQAICQTRCRHRRRSLKIFHTIFPNLPSICHCTTRRLL